MSPEAEKVLVLVVVMVALLWINTKCNTNDLIIVLLRVGTILGALGALVAVLWFGYQLVIA